MNPVISIALETNGKGYLGFLCELPGAFIRGITLDQALLKMQHEATIYQRWLGNEENVIYDTKVVQIHYTSLMVEDADSEILLDADRGEMDDKEFEKYIALIHASGLSVLHTYNSVELKDWIDEERIRKTFYGPTPKTIQEIFDHVNAVQSYYLSRLYYDTVNNVGFMEKREYCLDRISKVFKKENNYRTYDIDHELWTVKKVLRRFLWHDRIHAKSIIKILKKQKQYGLIKNYLNLFYF